MDLACQAIVPGYESGVEDLSLVANLMIDVAAKKEDVVFPEKFKIESLEQAHRIFTSLANATMSITNYLIQGASIILEYGDIEALSAAELEELVDEL